MLNKISTKNGTVDRAACKDAAENPYSGPNLGRIDIYTLQRGF
jgi:hypothetical protein